MPSRRCCDVQSLTGPAGDLLVAIALAALELLYGAVRLVHPHLIDMVITTLAAGYAMLA